MVQVIWAQVTPACQTCNRSLHFALLIYKSDKKKKEKRTGWVASIANGSSAEADFRQNAKINPAMRSIRIFRSSKDSSVYATAKILRP